ncbi:MAG: hypothetical protein ACK4N5_05890 [Myxococcales bacterium]
MSEHTKEPWQYDRTMERIVDGPNETILVGHNAFGVLVLSDANARRIVAAVNACAGLSTEALEKGVVGEMVKALRCAGEVLASRERSRDPLALALLASRLDAVLSRLPAEVRDGE